MNAFLESDIFVSDIVLAMAVGNVAETSMVNRQSYGLAMRTESCNTAAFIFSDGKTVVHHPSEIIFFPIGSSYRWELLTHHSYQPSMICYAINFQMNTDQTFEPFSIQTNNPAQLLKYFKRASNAWLTRQPGCKNTCLASLYSILSILKEEHYASYIPKAKKELIWPAIRYIEEHMLDESLHVRQLAALCGVSEAYFRKIFHIIYGVTPKQYIAQLRLNQAHTLLLSGEYSVTNVAELCGFLSDDYFIRVFKIAYGITPGQFRQQIQR